METTSFVATQSDSTGEEFNSRSYHEQDDDDQEGLISVQDQDQHGIRRVTRIIQHYWKAFIIIAGPLLLLPLAIGSQEAKAGYVILLVALFWVTEAAPLAGVALLPLCLFPLLGVLTASQASASYLKDANVLFMGGLIMAVAVERWSLHERIALAVLMLLGTSKSMLLFSFMLVTGFLSMWISNTASSAMMLPIAQAVLEVLDSGVAEQSSDDSGTEQSREPNQTAGATHTDSAENQKRTDTLRFKKGMMLAVAYSASIGGIATLTGTGPNLVMAGQVSTLYPTSSGISFVKWMLVGLPTAALLLFFGWLWLSLLFDRQGNPLLRVYRFLRRRLTEKSGKYTVNERQAGDTGATGSDAIQSVQVVLRQRYQRLGRLTFAECVVLVDFILLVLAWLFRHPGLPGFDAGWSSLFRDTDAGKSYVSDSTVAIVFSSILFFLPSEWPLSKEQRSSRKPIKRILDWDSVHTKLPWSVIIILGAGFCLAEASKESKLSCWFGLKLSNLSELNPTLVQFLIILFITLFTEVASNVASATIFLPILAQLTTSGLHKNPLWLMIPATISCSFAFMLPAATPPNAIAFSYGHLKVPDMVKAGCVMNLLGILTVFFTANTIARAVFTLDTFPDWATSNVTDPSSCAPLVVPNVTNLTFVT
ncbi:Na(+)/citrate cotransporter-like [Sycon ciliatum]|uniref:Na(+)/citrate cotransporter-like n=1 Tax=Sycon ciliatum TaxID=27933 RepID=UPI0020ABB471|eukprot:scpid35912/ scgid6495/ Solute carrier family 13 member 2; Na(+)/dicarboxylate cotransporter 1; Renal sodium/dicarboxylate cotransporter